MEVIKSKSKRLKKIILPEFKGNRRLARYPINLEGGNILPEEFEEYIPIVRQMLKECPIKQGNAILNIQEEAHSPVGNYGVVDRAVMVLSNKPYCRGWNGKFQTTIGVGGNKRPQSSKLKISKSFELKSNTLYICNSNFVYETINCNREINQVGVSIILPHDINIK